MYLFWKYLTILLSLYTVELKVVESIVTMKKLTEFLLKYPFWDPQSPNKLHKNVWQYVCVCVLMDVCVNS